MSKTKPSKFVRVRLDFAIEFDAAADAMVLGPRDADRMMVALHAVLTGNPKINGIAPGMRTTTSLDTRSRDENGALVK